MSFPDDQGLKDGELKIRGDSLSKKQVFEIGLVHTYNSGSIPSDTC